MIKFATNKKEGNKYPLETLAAIAQSVEHFIRNEKVLGSSPSRGSKKNSATR